MVPAIIYGTAWKQEATASLLAEALAAGYRAVDTANQRKHYREDLAGEAVRRSGLPRAALFLQTKYTYQESQDSVLPYDPNAPLAEQVRASFESSLAHFGTDYLDSFLLHGPRSARGMSDDDWEVWEALEELYRRKKARTIGVSNVGPAHLQELAGRARIKPMFVQNRCFAARGWDRAVRERCAADGIAYQGFSLLSANPHVVGAGRLEAIARRLGATREQLVFRFAAAIGIVALTGTTDERHMRQDLEALSLELSPADLEAIGSI